MTEMTLDVAGLIIGTMLVYFLPGFPWTFVIFDGGVIQLDKEGSAMIRAIERIVLSVGLSLVLVPFTTFVINVFIDVRPSVLNSLLVSLIPMTIGLVVFYLRKNGYLRSVPQFLQKRQKTE
jgi:uncharacterized membrane protein